MASPLQAQSAPASHTTSGTVRETLHPPPSTHIRTIASSARISADKHQLISRSSRCRFPLSTQTILPSRHRLTRRLPSTLPSASSAHPAAYPQIADPPPTTCTSRPDDPPD